MKPKTVFICQSCGFNAPKWMGRCPGCGEWSTLIEETTEASDIEYAFPPAEPMRYDEIRDGSEERKRTGTAELDRVLGGGVVIGSLSLIGGEPGIGKSTLLLQVSRDITALGEKTLYVSGEESLQQIKMRGQRLGVNGGDLYLLAETNLERILNQAENMKPGLFVLDSVQTIFSSKLSSAPGTISQVREAAGQVFRFAKKTGTPSFLIGHITKDGTLAGPKSLEHMVDVVLYFEGERDHNHRVLRVLKNRFGPVSELALFEMGARGLTVVPNPSAFFLKERPIQESGSVVVCTVKGSRPLLAEIQALVSSTFFSGSPRRMTVGLDHYRTSMLLAIVEKKLGFSFSGEDIYLNVAGGLEIAEPAADLGIIAAIVSCLKNRPVPSDTVLFGEVGLSGEVRSVGQPLARIKEAHSMGFKNAILPAGNLRQLEKEDLPQIELRGVKHVKDAIGNIF